MPVYPMDDSEDNSVDLPALASPGMVRAAVGYSGTELHNIAVHLYKDDYWTLSQGLCPMYTHRETRSDFARATISLR